MRYYVWILLFFLAPLASACSSIDVEPQGIPEQTSYGEAPFGGKIKNATSGVSYRMVYKSPSTGKLVKTPLVRPSNRDADGNFDFQESARLSRLGVNEVGVEVVNSKGISVNFHWQKIKRTKPRVFAVIIGISNYQAESYRGKARYAVQDAKAFENYMVDHLGVRRERVITLLDDKATYSGIRRMLGEDLPGRVNRDDMVFIYFAGLGATEVLRNSEAVQYLICSDTSPKAVFASAISMEELRDTLFKKIMSRCRRLVFFGDLNFEYQPENSPKYSFQNQRTATQALHRKSEESVMTSQIEDILLKANGYGMAMIMPRSMSYDDPDLQHQGTEKKGAGIFTYHLIQGLKGEADGAGGRERDNVVTVEELLTYLNEEVIKKGLPDSIKPQQYLHVKGTMFVGARK